MQRGERECRLHSALSTFWPGKYSHPRCNTRQGSCCRRSGGPSERIFLAFEQNQIRQHTITKDSLGARLHIRPPYALRLFLRRHWSFLIQGEDGRENLLTF